jgi:hypothetical protein
MALYMGDPPRKVITRYLRALTGGAKVEYHTYYHMNVATPEKLTRHLDQIGNKLARF